MLDEDYAGGRVGRVWRYVCIPGHVRGEALLVVAPSWSLPCDIILPVMNRGSGRRDGKVGWSVV